MRLCPVFADPVTYRVGVFHRKKTMTLAIAIDNAAQYNDKGEWLYVSLQMWIHAPLQTDKWVWLHICLQKVSGMAHKEIIAHCYTYASSN